MVDVVEATLGVDPIGDLAIADEAIADQHIVGEAILDELDVYGVTTPEADVHINQVSHVNIEEHTGGDTKNGLS